MLEHISRDLVIAALYPSLPAALQASKRDGGPAFSLGFALLSLLVAHAVRAPQSLDLVLLRK